MDADVFVNHARRIPDQTSKLIIKTSTLREYSWQPFREKIKSTNNTPCLFAISTWPPKNHTKPPLPRVCLPIFIHTYVTSPSIPHHKLFNPPPTLKPTHQTPTSRVPTSLIDSSSYSWCNSSSPRTDLTGSEKKVWICVEANHWNMEKNRWGFAFIFNNLHQDLEGAKTGGQCITTDFCWRYIHSL